MWEYSFVVKCAGVELLKITVQMKLVWLDSLFVITMFVNGNEARCSV